MANGAGNSKEVPRGAWPVVGCRMSPEDRRTINRAAAHLDINRSEFMYKTLIREANRVLAEAA